MKSQNILFMCWWMLFCQNMGKNMVNSNTFPIFSHDIHIFSMVFETATPRFWKPRHPNGRIDFGDRFTEHGAQCPGTAFDGQSLGTLDFHLEMFEKNANSWWYTPGNIEKTSKKTMETHGFLMLPLISNWEKNIFEVYRCWRVPGGYHVLPECVAKGSRL